LAAEIAGHGDENNEYSGDSSNEENVVSMSSDQSFPLLEVKVDGQKDEAGPGENNSGSSAKPVSKKASDRVQRHQADDGKSKSQSTVSTLTQKSSSTTEHSAMEDSCEQNVDNVMGSPVTANNADAQLSSLLIDTNKESSRSDDDTKVPPEKLPKLTGPHIHRKHARAPRSESSVTQKHESSQSSSSTDCPTGQKAVVDSSKDSGNKGSNESSDDYGEESSNSGTASSMQAGQYLCICSTAKSHVIFFSHSCI
jgi:hypothetical protein